MKLIEKLMKLWRKLVIIFKDKWPLYKRIVALRKMEFNKLYLFKLIKKLYPKQTPEKSINELRAKLIKKSMLNNKEKK